MKENMNNEVIEEAVAVDEVNEPERKGFFAKVGTGIKKNGKKVALGVGAAVVTVGAVGFALVKAFGKGSDNELIDASDVIDCDDSEEVTE